METKYQGSLSCPRLPNMADYQVSDAEIIQIANSFLLASPPGEFMEVVTGTLAG